MPFPDDQIVFARKAADQSYDAILGFFGDKTGGGATATVTATVVAALVLVIAVVLAVALGVIFRAGGFVTALFLETLGEARKDNQDSLNGVIAGAMSDLLGVSVEADDIPAGGDPEQQVQRMEVIGGKLFDLLTREFGGNGGPEGIDGEKAAKAFAGFAINFSTASAFLSIVTELESLGFLKQFREIGEMMSKSLGIGRLLRGAFRPLIDHTITLPYNRQLGARYQQQRMSDSDIINAWKAGLIQDEQFNTDMQEKGYRPVDVDALVALHSSRLTFADIDALLRHGTLTVAEAQGYAQRQGFNFEDGDKIRDLPALARQDAIEQQYVHDAFQLARDRHMTEADFQSVLDSVKISDGEKQLWAQRLSLYILHPRKRVALAQLLYLSERHQVTDAEVDAWTEAEGYDPENAALISLYVLGKDLDFDTAQTTKAAKAKAAATAAAAKAAAAAAKGSKAKGV